jgi:Lon-like protease
MWLAILLVGLIFAAAPMPFMIFSPQPPTSVEEMIRIEGARRPLSGELLASSVGYRQGTPALALWALIDPGREIVPMPDEIEAPSFDESPMARSFSDSVIAGAAVGLELAGYDVSVTSDGLEVVAVVENTPTDGLLATGDLLVEADGRRLVLPADLKGITASKAVGDAIDLHLRRGGSERNIEIPIDDLGDGRPGIGVHTVAVRPVVHFPPDVGITGIGDAEGGSAGLLIALAVYDRFADEPLLGGMSVTGTGVVDLEGNVHAIDGIAQKVRAAQATGAWLFLAPASQYEEALAAASEGMKVLSVATVHEAVNALP